MKTSEHSYYWSEYSKAKPFKKALMFFTGRVYGLRTGKVHGLRAYTYTQVNDGKAGTVTRSLTRTLFNREWATKAMKTLPSPITMGNTNLPVDDWIVYMRYYSIVDC
jgi:hypothetical protein